MYELNIFWQYNQSFGVSIKFLSLSHRSLPLPLLNLGQVYTISKLLWAIFSRATSVTLVPICPPSEAILWMAFSITCAVFLKSTTMCSREKDVDSIPGRIVRQECCCTGDGWVGSFFLAIRSLVTMLNGFRVVVFPWMILSMFSAACNLPPFYPDGHKASNVSLIDLYEFMMHNKLLCNQCDMTYWVRPLLYPHAMLICMSSKSFGIEVDGFFL